MKKMTMALGLIFLLSAKLHAAELLTMDEAVATALKSHPLTIEADENVSVAEAQSGQAFANYYPSIAIAADWSKGRSYLTPLESVRRRRCIPTPSTSGRQFTISGEPPERWRLRGKTDTAAADPARVTRQDVAFRVRVAYYLLLAAEKQVAATRETVTAKEAVFRQAQEFFSQGIRAKVDVARAEANLYEARTALIRAESNREIGRVELANAMGLSSLGGRVPAEPAASPALLSGLEESLRDAFTARAELRQYAALKNAAEATVKTARSGHFPILSGTASVGYADSTFPPDGNVWAVGVNLTVPIFSGFSTVEREKETRASLRAAEARQSNLKLRIANEVESAWLSARDAAARIASTGKEVAAATENRDLAMGRYQEGVGSIIEVTDAQSQALDAETARIQAGYDYHAAMARLDRALGKE